MSEPLPRDIERPAPQETGGENVLGWRERFRQWRDNRRRLRLSIQGKVFVVLSLGIALGAVNTANNLLYLILGAMCAFLLLNGLFAEISLRGIEIWRSPPPVIHAGRETSITVGVRNHKEKTASFNIAVRESFGRKRWLDSVTFAHVPPGAVREGAYRCVFPRRGRCRFRGWMLETSFPFGMFLKAAYVEDPDTAVVYPRTNLAVAIPRLPGVGGEHGDALRGHGEEFHGLREYRPGDDHRRVAWKVSARRRELIVKDSAHGAVSRVDIFIANIGRSAQRDPIFESAIDHAASLAMRLLASGFAVGLTTLHSRLEPGSGPPQAGRILHELALLAQMVVEELTEPLSNVLPPPRDTDRIVIETSSSRPFTAPAGPVAAVIAVDENTDGSTTESPSPPLGRT